MERNAIRRYLDEHLVIAGWGGPDGNSVEPREVAFRLPACDCAGDERGQGRQMKQKSVFLAISSQDF
jgi:hypothetical protein